MSRAQRETSLSPFMVLIQRAARTVTFGGGKVPGPGKFAQMAVEERRVPALRTCSGTATWTTLPGDRPTHVNVVSRYAAGEGVREEGEWENDLFVERER